MAKSSPRSILLTDDNAARIAAKELAIRAHGTIGVLLRAVRRGQRSKVNVIALLEKIPTRSSLHIKPSLLAEAIIALKINE